MMFSHSLASKKNSKIDNIYFFSPTLSHIPELGDAPSSSYRDMWVHRHISGYNTTLTL